MKHLLLAALMLHCSVQRIQTSSGPQWYWISADRLTPYGGLCATMWQSRLDHTWHTEGHKPFLKKSDAINWIEERCKR